jgi:hypothetical protein
MNYFAYFTEIEERFSRRRGSILLLNTLDWALIETWREAGIPLEAVLRGIDDAFDKYDARAAKARGRSQKVNGLAWCSQAVMHAAEEMVEASTGLAPVKPQAQHESGFESERVAKYLERNADTLGAPGRASETWAATAVRLRELATAMRSEQPLALDELDRTRRQTLRRTASYCHRAGTRRAARAGRPRTRTLPRQDVRSATPPGTGAVSPQAPTGAALAPKA